PEVHARFAVVLPLLEMAELVVAISLAAQVRHLREMGIVPERERGRFDAACSDIVALRGSTWAEAAIVVLALAMSIGFRLVIGVTEGSSSWERTETAITPAGWWHMLVSLPILYFFLFRWIWVFTCWAVFLRGVSRLDLELTATHPDRAGGLGFLGWGLACFASVLLPISTGASAGLAQEILHFGETLDSLKYHVVAYIVVAMVLLHAPLLTFAGRLSRCRFKGLLEFGALVWRHDRAFDEKWLQRPPEEIKENL